MSAHLDILSAGPGVSMQDLGRPGHLATGLARGGAADRLALFEAAALLGLPGVVAGIEMAGSGGRFRVSAPTRFALTGAVMQASIDATPLPWHASHKLYPGQELYIAGAKSGVFGYLTPFGGVQTPLVLGSRAAHLAVGLGAVLCAADSLPIGPDPTPDAASMRLRLRDRFSGGGIRLMPGPQTDLFAPETLAAFLAATFTRSATGNRQAVRLDHGGAPFPADIQGLASDLVTPGDIQMAGDGVAYVLLSECQTTGGYPRIATVIDADLPLIAQTPPGAKLRFNLLTLAQADAAFCPEAGLIAALRANVAPLIRNPHDMGDLLSYQLIGGVVSGSET